MLLNPKSVSMKTIFLFAIVGLVSQDADAQSRKSRYDINFRICQDNGVYKPCSEVKKTHLSSGQNDQLNQQQRIPDTDNRVDMTHNHTHYLRSRIRVTYSDNANAPYKGEESMQNDGVQKTVNRNLNYLDGAAQLPPNDGSINTR